MNAWRIITGTGFILALILVMVAPVSMPDPDDWAYYYGVHHFAEGRFTINNTTWYQDAMQTAEQGNALLQYLPIAYDKWALEKAPGYVLYLIPFYTTGLPRLGNLLLAAGLVLAVYLLLKRLRDEKTAALGSLLVLFTPISLVMLNRVYMDTFAAMAFLSIGGALYFYYHLERSAIGNVKGGILLFLAFFLIGWSVFTRYTNLPVAVLIFLHFCLVRSVPGIRRPVAWKISEALPLALGIGLPVLALGLYDYLVFGSPFTYGYKLTPYPISFAFQYLGQQYGGESIPLQILRYNLLAMARNLGIGFPLMVIAVPALALAVYGRFRSGRRNHAVSPGGRDWYHSLPGDLRWLLVGWLISVFGLYLFYEWTAGIQSGGGFVIFNRFLLPGLFPVALVSALALSRWRAAALVPVMLVLVIGGVLLYLQWAFDLHILPAVLTVRTLDSRWPGYVFPPWVQYPPADSGGPYFPWHVWPQGAGPYPPR